MAKGMELPLNAIIVIAIAILVLVSVGGFFFGFFSDSSVDTKKLFAQGCASLRAFHSCDHKEINQINLENTNFGYVCGRSGYTDTAVCAKACGCAVPEGESGQSLSAVSGRDISFYEAEVD
jgi:hypothetical protein